MATWVKIDKGAEQEYDDLDKAFSIRLNQSLGSIFVVYPGLTVIMSSIGQPNAFARALDYLRGVEASL